MMTKLGKTIIAALKDAKENGFIDLYAERRQRRYETMKVVLFLVFMAACFFAVAGFVYFVFKPFYVPNAMATLRDL